MAYDQQNQQGSSNRIQIIVAVISVIGGLGAAAIANPELLAIASSKDIPAGNYRLTCPESYRSVEGKTLTAKCYDTEGQLRESSLKDFQDCTFGIENFDGQLSCRPDA